MSRVKIITVEKSYIIRAGLNKIINNYKDVEVAVETENLDNINKLSNKIKPDIIIVNLKIPKNPNDNLKQKYNLSNKIKLIAIVGTKKKKEYFEHYDESFCIDDSKFEIDKKIMNIINSLPKKQQSGKNELTEREKDIVKLVAQGMTNKEIANRLFISIHTVITHRKNITKKLDIKTVSGITVYAIMNKLISLQTIH